MNAMEQFGQGQRLFIEGKLEECVGAFTKALDEGFDKPLVFLSRGVAYFKMNKMEEAIQDFTRTIEKDSNNTRAYYYRGIAYLSKEDYDRASPDLDKTIELNPDHGAAYLTRGTVYALMGDDENASRYIKNAIIKSETNIQGFSDDFGISRTLFDRAMGHLSGLRQHDPTLELTEDEIEMVKKWLEVA